MKVYTRTGITLVALVVSTSLVRPAVAQSVDHTDVVVTAKAAAVNAGINVDADECSRFEITKRVAVLLAGEHAGLLDKPSGNNCQGFAVDIIAYPSGAIVDILGSGSDGPNTPHWLVQAPVDPARYRAPIADGPPPARAPASEPPATQEDHDAAIHRIEAQLEAIRADLATLRTQSDANTEKIQQQIDQAIKNLEKSAPGFAAALLKVLTLGAAGK